MKKIILIALVALTATMTFGQRRVDMSVSMTSPTASTIIRTGVPFTVTLTITNNGPDAIKTTDSLIYLLGVGNTIFPTTATLLTLSSNINSGATANFSLPNMQISGGNGGAMILCSHVVLNNRVLPDTVKDNAIGGSSNNSSCVNLNYSGTGVGKVQAGMSSVISIYPNPASNNVTIGFTSVSSEVSVIEIYDIQGRIIKSINSDLTQVGEQSVNIDISDFTKGVYFCKVITGNNSAMNKFIVE